MGVATSPAAYSGGSDDFGGGKLDRWIGLQLL
jgi:hypothetical protein